MCFLSRNIIPLLGSMPQFSFNLTVRLNLKGRIEMNKNILTEEIYNRVQIGKKNAFAFILQQGKAQLQYGSALQEAIFYDIYFNKKDGSVFQTNNSSVLNDNNLFILVFDIKGSTVNQLRFSLIQNSSIFLTSEEVESAYIAILTAKDNSDIPFCVSGVLYQNGDVTNSSLIYAQDCHLASTIMGYISMIGCKEII
jgi:hypothetical protein